MNFWSHISPSNKQKTILSAVVDPITGVVKCDPDQIKSEVENHVITVFQGSFEQVTAQLPQPVQSDHGYAQCPRASFPGRHPDHSYSVNPSPVLVNRDSSGTVESNPSGWLNSQFEVCELSCLEKVSSFFLFDTFIGLTFLNLDNFSFHILGGDEDEDIELRPRADNM